MRAGAVIGQTAGDRGKPNHTNDRIKRHLRLGTARRDSMGPMARRRLPCSASQSYLQADWPKHISEPRVYRESAGRRPRHLCFPSSHSTLPSWPWHCSTLNTAAPTDFQGLVGACWTLGGGTLAVDVLLGTDMYVGWWHKIVVPECCTAQGALFIALSPLLLSGAGRPTSTPDGCARCEDPVERTTRTWRRTTRAGVAVLAAPFSPENASVKQGTVLVPSAQADPVHMFAKHGQLSSAHVCRAELRV